MKISSKKKRNSIQIQHLVYRIIILDKIYSQVTIKTKPQEDLLRI
jgi:hypothetical protein